jgi:hypothetical protein
VFCCCLRSSYLLSRRCLLLVYPPAFRVPSAGGLSFLLCCRSLWGLSQTAGVPVSLFKVIAESLDQACSALRCGTIDVMVVSLDWHGKSVQDDQARLVLTTLSLFHPALWHLPFILTDTVVLAYPVCVCVCPQVAKQAKLSALKWQNKQSRA